MHLFIKMTSPSAGGTRVEEAVTVGQIPSGLSGSAPGRTLRPHPIPEHCDHSMPGRREAPRITKISREQKNEPTNSPKATGGRMGASLKPSKLRGKVARQASSLQHKKALCSSPLDCTGYPQLPGQPSTADSCIETLYHPFVSC